MRVAELLDVLRTLAPERLAEPWDKVGLHLGDGAWDVSRALLCIDLTEPVMREAAEQGVNLIVAYHPPIFSPLVRVTADDWKGRVVLEALHRRIAVYCPHTALDAAAGGVNDWLCGSAGPAADIRPIRPASPRQEIPRYKLVTFVTPADLERVRQALCAAGAGHIGDYSECTFAGEGEGTFRGGASTDPAIGQRGRLEQVTERRLETVVPEAHLAAVVAALTRAHPYEEPAFDLLRLGTPPDAGDQAAGPGRVVTLERPMTVEQLAEGVKRRLGVQRVDVAKPQAAGGPGELRRIGFCAGAGGSLLEEAGGVDAFVTGEMRHHDVLDAVQRGVAIVLAGHTQTERPYLPTYRQRIIDAGGGGVQWSVSQADVAPL